MAVKTFPNSALTISVCFVVLTLAGTARAKTIYVDDNAPGNNKGFTWTNAYNDLRDAITDARSSPKPVEIRVAQGIYKPKEGVFVLINGITLKGGYAGFEESDPEDRDINLYKTILSGDCNGDDVEVIDPMDLWSEPTRADNVCVVHSTNCNETAVLDGFIITAGRSLSGGGGMYNYNSSPTIINCTFSANTAGDDGLEGGGAIYSYYGNPVLINCEFIGNSAGDSCGGGGMYNDYSNPTLINCTFIANTAEYYGGGMINFWSNPILTDCTFTDNFSPYRGGGMHNDSGSFKPILTNCTFIRNRSDGDGGGMYGSSHNSPILTNCTFRGNSAEECGGAICNGASGDGGGSPTINNCMFTGNRAGENGGAVHNGPHSNTMLTRCTFSDNSASNGNALACNSVYQKYPSDLEITNCIIWDGGNEIWNNDNSTISITYSNIQSGWTGQGNIDIDPCFVEPGYWEPNGVWIDGDYHLFTDSPCIDAGDPNYIAGPNETDLDGNPRVIAGRIDMGVYEFQSNLILYVDTDATGANDGSSWADAFNFLQNALATAYYSDKIHVAHGTYKPDQGNGITPGDREATFQLINGVTIKGGYAGFGTPDPNTRDIELYKTILTGDLNGDDVEVNDPADLLYEPTRSENSYNVVTGSGTDETAILDGFTITGGNADGSYPNNCGGGMYNYRGSPTVANCMLRSNAARSDGGGVCNYGSYKATPRLTNCTFKRNSSRRCGGGMCNWDGEATLTNCTFIGNSTADDGGGIYISNDSKLALTYCTFRGNLAGRSGGGIVGGDSTLNNCTFDWNLAGRFGGGIYVIGRPTLTDCTFSGNSAGFGGGVASYFGPTLTNCRITGNAAVYYGGGLASFGYGSPRLTNCTFAGNSAPNGTALACDSLPGEPQSQLVLTNSILWDGGDEIWNNDGSTIIITYSDVQGGWLGEGNIDDAPLFVELGYWEANGTPYDANDDFWVEGDYHLLTDSPCIDTGEPNYIAGPNETDLDGRPRIIGGRIDMGAYEAPIFAGARILPRTINLASKGNWVTCYICLPDEYDVADIEPNSIFLEDDIQPQQFSVDQQQQVATARFSREDVQPVLEVGDINLKIIGRLTDGTVFEALYMIKVIDKAGKN